jgi:hypothetical protein
VTGGVCRLGDLFPDLIKWNDAVWGGFFGQGETGIGRVTKDPDFFVQCLGEEFDQVLEVPVTG